MNIHLVFLVLLVIQATGEQKCNCSVFIKADALEFHLKENISECNMNERNNVIEDVNTHLTELFEECFELNLICPSTLVIMTSSAYSTTEQNTITTESMATTQTTYIITTELTTELTAEIENSKSNNYYIPAAYSLLGILTISIILNTVFLLYILKFKHQKFSSGTNSQQSDEKTIHLTTYRERSEDQANKGIVNNSAPIYAVVHKPKECPPPLPPTYSSCSHNIEAQHPHEEVDNVFSEEGKVSYEVLTIENGAEPVYEVSTKQNQEV